MKTYLVVFMIFSPFVGAFAEQSYYIDKKPDGSYYEADGVGKTGFERWARTEEFTMTLSDLPSSGTLEKVPWSGSNWPGYRGEINWRWYNPHNIDDNIYEYGYAKEQNGEPYEWDYVSIRPQLSLEHVKKMTEDEMKNLSPAEKFDIYRGVYGGDESIASLIVEEFEWDIIEQPWAGFCGGWSAAALNFEQPGSVLLKNADGIDVPFGSSDIKALLTYYFDGGMFLKEQAGVHSLFEEVDFEEAIQIFKKIAVSVGDDCKQGYNDGSCGEDLTPGQFHILLGNLVGLKNKGFIVDVQADYNRYYQPLWAYDASLSQVKGRPGLIHVVTAIKTSVDLTEKPGIVIDFSNPDHFIYTSPSYEKVAPEDFRTQTLTYEYLIEIDSDGKIVANSDEQKWLSSSQPDSAFMWQKPNRFGGPFSELNEIFEASIK